MRVRQSSAADATAVDVTAVGATVVNTTAARAAALETQLAAAEAQKELRKSHKK